MLFRSAFPGGENGNDEAKAFPGGENGNDEAKAFPGGERAKVIEVAKTVLGTTSWNRWKILDYVEVRRCETDYIFERGSTVWAVESP